MIIDFDKVTIQERAQWSQLLMCLHDKQVISTKTLITEMGLDYDEEKKRLREEAEVKEKIDEKFKTPTVDPAGERYSP